MEAKAYLRNVRIAPRKVKIVLDLIRGKDIKVAQAILQQLYEENRFDPAPRVPDEEPCFAPVYAAPPIPGPDEPRTAPVYAAPPIPGPNEPRRTPVPAAPSPSKPKKGLFERLFGRRKKP